MLDTLLGVIQRQKAIATTIGEELGTESATGVPAAVSAGRLTALLLRLPIATLRRLQIARRHCWKSSMARWTGRRRRLLPT